jgi:antitoxin component of RelBE/YafQ-DinJ toxin-antitoxin module
MWHIRFMTEILRVRMEKDLVRKAREVCAEIGTHPQEIVRMMFAQLVKQRALPFPAVADKLKQAPGEASPGKPVPGDKTA